MKFKLVCFDMDGVLFDFSNSWMNVHKAFGTLEEGKILTEKYLKKDYDKLVEEVVNKLWKGRDATPFFEMIDNIEYIEGVKETFDYLRNEGIITAIISSGILQLAKRAQHDLNINHVFANELVIKNNKITGEFIWPIGAGYDEKPRIIKDLANQLKIKLEEIIYIGDELVDVEAFKIVGKSIAFNATKKEVKNAAEIIVDSKNLRDILKYLK